MMVLFSLVKHKKTFGIISQNDEKNCIYVAVMPALNLPVLG